MDSPGELCQVGTWEADVQKMQASMNVRHFCSCIMLLIQYQSSIQPFEATHRCLQKRYKLGWVKLYEFLGSLKK
ncbi:MAG TPA: hypothetical protein DDZ80_16255 [Cyanobacteria bacterium UBA8803]|nr:hypothetical protein [Cyanobacteria bacterium UBA9273]HBL59965.1 hypothetical protein [Cyanobacteria bacterium UBA8803]